MSLNVIESPRCLVRGGGWSTDLLTFKSTESGLGAGWGRGWGGAVLRAKRLLEYFFPPVDPASFSVLFRAATTYPSLWVFLAPETDSCRARNPPSLPSKDTNTQGCLCQHGLLC